ncbi:MAG: GH25 family lysozyme [Lachnospiraceae bacterium]|nr:GH25 family lysozyme [Lachnospiraceae bacterium]
MRRDKRLDGIDVSNWEGKINFRKVREAGIRIVYIKATQGQNITDPDFERNYREAEREKLRIGFYHYVMAKNLEEAKKEADFFYSRTRDKVQHARPAMDFEEFGTLDYHEIQNISLEFLSVLETKTGHRPVIYSDASNAASVFDNGHLRKYPLWIAQYGAERPDMENQWKRWSGWQYTDSGHVKGVHGKVDRDYFRRSILIHEKG